MSNPIENILQNSSEDELTKPKEMVVDYQSPALHIELASIFKTMVSESISAIGLPPEVQMIENASNQALEDVPKSISKSKELDTNVATPGTAAHKKSRLTTSIVVEKRRITFELPKHCIVDQIDMDKLPSVDANNNPVGVPVRSLSFRERLEGWSIERRQRPNKSHDLFYRHPKSSRLFRSIPEVVRFLLYEIFPNYTSRKENKLMLIEDLDKPMTTEAPTMKSLCMSASSGDRSEQESARKIVEKFLKDTYNNLINSGSKSLAENHDHESEYVWCE